LLFTTRASPALAIDGQINPFDLSAAQLGPAPGGNAGRQQNCPPRWPWSADVRSCLAAQARNIFCVGKTGAHAQEFAGGFDSSAKSGGDVPADPIIFTKVRVGVVD
jgi:hypothetical protein